MIKRNRVFGHLPNSFCMETRLLQGTMKTFRIGRRIGGRRTLLSLISGAAVSLLVLALMPHPTPNSRSQALGHRRIHQENTDDYTAPPKSLRSRARPSEATAASRSNGELKGSLESSILEIAKEAGGHSLPILSYNRVMSSNNKRTQVVHDADTGVGYIKEENDLNRNIKRKKVYDRIVHNARDGPLNLTLSQVDALSQLVDVPRNPNEEGQLAKAQETALAALQHGFKLTEGQKKLVQKMSPNERKKLEEKVSRVRIVQERSYMKQLRAKNQIKRKKGGGEEIYSSPQMPVRFPASLQKVHPRDWPEQYKIFLNISHYPWARTADCTNYSINFDPPDTRPTKALASFPSSGNTWIRYLVEAATGMFTGSLYDDSSLTKKGMYGEGIVYDSGMTILQKSHGYTTGDAMKLPHEERRWKNHMTELGFRGVIIIRNPFKALISHRHLDTGGHTGYAPKNQFIGTGWAEFVTLKIMLWKEFYMDWLTFTHSDDIHITYYEKVKENITREMENILKYLKLPLDSNRLSCVGKHSDGLFKRKPSKNVPLDFNPYTQELKDLIYEAIDEVDQLLRSKDKDPLPRQLFELYDSHEAEISRSTRRKRTSTQGS